jgi:hypothetical protein
VRVSRTMGGGTPPLRCEANSKLSMTSPNNDNKPWTDNLPFPRHWLAYLILKIAVIFAAIIIVLYLTGLVA